MKKTILFIAIFAFLAGSSIAVSTVYSDQNKVELSSGNEGDSKKDDTKKEDKAKKSDAKESKSKQCSSSKECCKKGGKASDNKEKKDKE
jgi:predicted porin